MKIRHFLEFCELMTAEQPKKHGGSAGDDLFGITMGNSVAQSLGNDQKNQMKRRLFFCSLELAA